MKRGRWHTFNMGDLVIERIGTGESAPNEVVEIVAVEPQIVVTSTGNRYDRYHGGRIPESDPYRSIRLPMPNEAIDVLGHCADEMQRDL